MTPNTVPDDYVGQDVWVRQQDDEIVIVHVDSDGAHESGTGKTFILEALGQVAVEAGLKVQSNASRTR